jgi:hypothetical protein
MPKANPIDVAETTPVIGESYECGEGSSGNETDDPESGGESEHLQP